MKLCELIKPNMNVARSTNLERDGRNSAVLKDYQVTNKTCEILGRFISALEGERVSAWSLTGPYGMGKSSFCNFLLAITGPLMDPNAKLALKSLKANDKRLHQRFVTAAKKKVDKEGFIRIYVTAAYESINHSLARGLHEALESLSRSDCANLSISLQNLRNQNNISSQTLFELYKSVLQTVNRPMVIILDEFGKNLDYMSHHHEQGDIFILQQLAELQSLYLWVVLHQAFDEYASGLSGVQRQEWSKVQGRFEDISFVESTKQMLYLIRNSITHNFNPEEAQKMEEWAKQANDMIHQSFMHIRDDLNINNIADMYPIHPFSAMVLIELCQKFAQNDRTLLSFMCNGDPQALPAFLSRTEWPDSANLPSIGLDYLYDYFFGITSTAYINRAESQRWLEIQDFIETYRTLSDWEISMFKSIGVINLLSSKIGIQANQNTIVDVMGYSNNIEGQSVIDALNDLTQRGILLYRKYAGEYRLWEGSDFDVYEAIREKKAKLSISSIDRLLQEYMPLTPVIASRHTYVSGTVRRFERQWLEINDLSDEIVPHQGFDGLFLYCYGANSKPGRIPITCKDGRPLLIAYTSQQTSLRELAQEVVAARAVLKDSPELKDEKAAKREVKFRIKSAEQQFREHIDQVFSPGSENLKWYADGERIEISTYRALSSKLSEMCDVCYSYSPRIGNEMISYQNLSSAAAKARRQLIEAMVDKGNTEQLGLTGFGPEVAIYRSLLLAPGLHIKDPANGEWSFRLNEQDAALDYVWHTIDSMVENSGDGGCTIAEILEALQAPPFGMRQGPAPIYITLYLLVHAEEIAVFQEGIYRPYLTPAEVALMLKRPEFFLLKQVTSNNLEREVFNIYRNLLKVAKIGGDKALRNQNMLGVVGPLIKYVEGLPAYARKTRSISREAQQVRLALQNSTDPIRLLFEELPQAVDLNLKDYDAEDFSWQEDLQTRLRSTLYELGHAYSVLNTRIQQVLLEIFAASDLNTLYREQRERMNLLSDICDDPELKALLQSFAREYAEPADWARGIAGIVVKKHLDSWNDQDFMPFTAKLRDYYDRIKQLETLASANGFLLRPDCQLLSLMQSSGRVNRQVIQSTLMDNAEVKARVKEILDLPGDVSKAIILALAESMVKEEENESA